MRITLAGCRRAAWPESAMACVTGESLSLYPIELPQAEPVHCVILREVTVSIRLAETDSDISGCFAVMRQLRPQLPGEAEFLQRVRRLQGQGYLLALVEEQGRAVCVAGFRVLENLPWGRFVYVDDLVTDEAGRSCGHGEAMLNWLIDYARRHDCDEFHLDSGVQRFGAHRFYLTHRMDIIAHHFALRLREG
jgi:GNAT superfamily N-acetyltransferase